LAQLYSAEAGVDSNIPDNKSDIAVGNIDSNILKKQHRHKTEKEY